MSNDVPMPSAGSSLPHVPFKVPLEGMTFEEYLQYLSWRIEIQMLAVFIQDWKRAASGGEKAKSKDQILNQLVVINRRAAHFPTQPLPENLCTTALDLTVSDEEPAILSVSLMLSELKEVFG